MTTNFFTEPVYHHVTYINEPQAYVTFTQPDPSHLYYHNCHECTEFSTMFGSRTRIKNEEDFEIIKGEFVKHFNENHRDLVEKRKPKPDRNYKKYPSVENPIYFTFHTQPEIR